MFCATSAKRYERLLKAHDIVLTPRGHGDGGGRARAPPKAPKTPRTTTRKRKPTRDDDEDEDGLDIKEEEDGGSPTKKSKVVSALDDGLCLTSSWNLENEIANMIRLIQTPTRSSLLRCPTSTGLDDFAKVWSVASRIFSNFGQNPGGTTSVISNSMSHDVKGYYCRLFLFSFFHSLYASTHHPSGDRADTRLVVISGERNTEKVSLFLGSK